MEKLWIFLKENVAAIITAVTAMLTVVYAALRLCIYVFWRGYFNRLYIDVSMMNLNFDNCIFAVVFVSIILFVVSFFVTWVHEINDDIKKREKERDLKRVRKIFFCLWNRIKCLLISVLIMSIINIPLTMLLMSLIEMEGTISNAVVLFFLLYIIEMLFGSIQRISIKPSKMKDKERELVLKIIAALVCIFVVLVMVFCDGNQIIDRKARVQLVSNEEYMISYCNGKNYILHRVEYEEGELVIHRNEQKIIGIEDCEYIIKKVEKVVVED